jgi:hypothetical protein
MESDFAYAKLQSITGEEFLIKNVKKYIKHHHIIIKLLKY